MYLGWIICSSWNYVVKVRSKEIGKDRTRVTFKGMKPLFTNRNLNMSLKIRMVRCYVLSVMLYGVEAWTMTDTLMRKLEAFEMWVYRRILRISSLRLLVLCPDAHRASGHNTYTTKKYSGEWARKKREYSWSKDVNYNIWVMLWEAINTDCYNWYSKEKRKVDGRRGPGRRENSWL